MATVVHGNIKTIEDAEKILISSDEIINGDFEMSSRGSESIWIVNGKIKAKHINGSLIIYNVKAGKSRKWLM